VPRETNPRGTVGHTGNLEHRAPLAYAPGVRCPPRYSLLPPRLALGAEHRAHEAPESLRHHPFRGL